MSTAAVAAGSAARNRPDSAPSPNAADFPAQFWRALITVVGGGGLPNPINLEGELHQAQGDAVRASLFFVFLAGRVPPDVLPADYPSAAVAHFPPDPQSAATLLVALFGLRDPRSPIRVPGRAAWAAWEQAIATHDPAAIRAFCDQICALTRAQWWLTSSPWHRVARAGLWGVTGAATGNALTQAALWGVTAVAAANTPRRLADEACLRARSYVHEQASIIARALERIGTPAALAELYRLTWRLPRRPMRRRVAEVLVRCAEKQGLDLETLKDRAAGYVDLDAQGRRTWPVGSYALELELTSTGVSALSFRNTKTGQEVRRLPPAVSAQAQDALAERRLFAKDVRESYAVETARLEAAMIAGRVWTGADWQAAFAVAPLMAHLARRLVWQIGSSAAAHCARPTAEGWRDASGQTVALPGDAQLCLPHPVLMPSDTLAAWGRHLEAEGVSQPFPQILRDTYSATPKEAAATISRRVAGQTVGRAAADRVMARLGWRGWAGGETIYLGYRDFPGAGYRVTVGLAPSTPRPVYPPVDLRLTLAGVWFTSIPHVAPNRRSEDNPPTPVVLSAVPPVVFSEALRDVMRLVRETGGS